MTARMRLLLVTIIIVAVGVPAAAVALLIGKVLVADPYADLQSQANALDLTSVGRVVFQRHYGADSVDIGAFVTYAIAPLDGESAISLQDAVESRLKESRYFTYSRIAGYTTTWCLNRTPHGVGRCVVESSVAKGEVLKVDDAQPPRATQPVIELDFH